MRLRILLRGVTLLRFLLYAKRSRGFKSRTHRADHFGKHRKRLDIPGGLLYEVIYERMADDFIESKLNKDSDEFARRRNGDVVRYDSRADLLGIKGSQVFIKTYFRPDPAVHGFANNLAYYFSERANA